VVDEVLEAHSTGSPTDEAVRWTDLVLVQLSQQVLARAGYRRRSLRKALISGDVDPHERDRQFRLIATLRRQARARGVPVLCVDTRKKERLGYLPRRGSCYSTDVQFVYDRDYRHLATGVLVPHGVYDYHGNAGFITLGTSRETSACVCDAIALAWQEDRAEHYPHAQQILLTFDAGAANAARSLRFKEDLVALSRRFGRRLRVALYPPYTSKRHPIEHRLFCHVARRLSGVILDSHQTALEAVQRTHTQTGLTVTPRLLDTLHEMGRKCSETFLDINDKFIRHDPVLGK